MSSEEALDFFKDNKKIYKYVKKLNYVGLLYLSLGQPLFIFSDGERQRLKLTKHIYEDSNIYVLDESTTGLYAVDINKIMELLDNIVDKDNTVIVIEHNLDVMKRTDYIIDIEADGGNNWGEVIFTGTPKENDR